MSHNAESNIQVTRPARERCFSVEEGGGATSFKHKPSAGCRTLMFVRLIHSKHTCGHGFVITFSCRSATAAVTHCQHCRLAFKPDSQQLQINPKVITLLYICSAVSDRHSSTAQSSTGLFPLDEPKSGAPKSRPMCGNQKANLPKLYESQLVFVFFFLQVDKHPREKQTTVEHVEFPKTLSARSHVYDLPLLNLKYVLD